MAKLEINLTKDQFEKLDETQKGFYVAHGDGYELEGIGGKIRGLEADKKRFEGFSGLNPDEAQKAVETLKSIGFEVDAQTLSDALELRRQAKDNELVELIKKGDLNSVKESVRSEVRAEYEGEKGKYTTLKSDYDQFFSKNSYKSLQADLTQSGVRAEYADDVATILTAHHIQPQLKNGEITWTDKSGGTADVTKILEGLKEKKPAYFGSNGASGGGASGSQSPGGQTAKTMTRAQWDAASPQDRTAFSQAGGSLTD
jgi:hypothetical protein